MKKKILAVVSSVLVAVVGFLFAVSRHPMMNDVSTNLDNPPEFFASEVVNEKRDLSYPEAFKEMQKQHYSQIQALEVDLTPENAFEKAKKIAVSNFGWKILQEKVNNTNLSEPQILQFHAVASTKVGFKDDVIVVISSLNSARSSNASSVDTGSAKVRIDVRSKSRLGKSDFGTNAQRIESFLTAFMAQ